MYIAHKVWCHVCLKYAIFVFIRDILLYNILLLACNICYSLSSNVFCRSLNTRHENTSLPQVLAEIWSPSFVAPLVLSLEYFWRICNTMAADTRLVYLLKTHDSLNLAEKVCLLRTCTSVYFQIHNEIFAMQNYSLIPRIISCISNFAICNC